MAKPKSKPKSKPTTWNVLANGQQISVEAVSMEIESSGALVFRASSAHVSPILRAFADGAWSTIELMVPDQD